MVHRYSRLKKLAHDVLKVGHAATECWSNLFAIPFLLGRSRQQMAKSCSKQVVIHTMRLRQARKQKQNLAKLPSPPKQTGARTTIMPLQRFMHNIEYSPKEKMLSVFISVPSKKVLH